MICRVLNLALTFRDLWIGDAGCRPRYTMSCLHMHAYCVSCIVHWGTASLLHNQCNCFLLLPWYLCTLSASLRSNQLCVVCLYLEADQNRFYQFRPKLSDEFRPQPKPNLWRSDWSSKILHLQTATDKQKQCSYDVVGLDRREIWAVTCSMYGHWRTDDKTAVILQCLSHFSDGPDSRAINLRRPAETRFHLRL